VLHNVFMVCKCSAIVLNSHVDAFVALNELQINDTAIDITNNKSIVYGNKVQKSHANGIVIKCTAAKANRKELPLTCSPRIERNHIEGSTQNGVTCDGYLCRPTISANTIEANRKTGVKLAFCARAHIGGPGESSQELSRILALESNGKSMGGPNDKYDREQHELYQDYFEDDLDHNEGHSEAGMTFTEVLEATRGFREQLVDSMNSSRYPAGNVITQNYGQGILLEESCSAKIYSNHIIDNLKANIALGGDASCGTDIKFNQIERGKKEGIFVVEGEAGLTID